MTFGWPHRHFRVTDSTNTRARELAAAGAPHGAVVTAAEQTEGRGRQGRAWTAPPGKALLYSAILRPLGNRPLLPLTVALAACEAAEALQPEIECRVKWPNDVQVDDRKLAGVLIEARPQDDWAVIGVGLNLAIEPEEFPPELRDSAASLDGGASPAKACDALSDGLGRWTEEADEVILAAWRRRDALHGREVAWNEGSGVADGVDKRGNLVVVTLNGDRVVLGAGEVHLTRV
jgi:BirA family biotin operon repressor/biotin-[acetyl-CoA-carboxylase] ligase